MPKDRTGSGYQALPAETRLLLVVIWTVVLACWVLRGVALGTPWPGAVVGGLYDGGLWLLTSVAAFRLVDFMAVPGRPGTRRSWLLRGALLSVLLVCGRTAAVQLLEFLTPLKGYSGAWHIVARVLPDQLLFAASSVGAAVAVTYHRESLRHRQQVMDVSLQAERARLDVLRSQMQPHFLFNALNAVSALLHQDPAKADRVLAQLGDLLRRSIRGTTADLVPLQEELDFTLAYLGIEQARYGERLHVEVDVADAARTRRVPVMLLQPLVENAVSHGIAAAGGVGRIWIVAGMDAGGRMRIEVRDNGGGISRAAGPGHPGVTLRNLRSRLTFLYGGEASMRIQSRRGQGTRVLLVLPRTPAAAPASRRGAPR